MEIITKFFLPDFLLKNSVTISMPRHATILSIHVTDDDNIFLFAKVNSERQLENRTFSWISSDQEIENNKIQFLGTVFFGCNQKQKMAAHVFENESPLF